MRSRVQKEQANFDSGLRFLELAENICRDHEATEEAETILGDVWHTIGAIANEINEPDRCLHYTQMVVDVKLRSANSTGIRDRNLAVAFNQHAIGLLMVGKLTEAEAEVREALAIMEKVVGDDKELMSGYVLNLGYSLWLQGRLEESRTTLEEGLLIRKKKFGINDKESYRSVTLLYCDSYIVADRVLTRTGAYLAALGNVYLAKGELAKAETLHCRAQTQYESTWGKWHHRTGDLHHMMARYEIRKQNWAEAELVTPSSALDFLGARLLTPVAAGNYCLRRC